MRAALLSTLPRYDTRPVDRLMLSSVWPTSTPTCRGGTGGKGAVGTEETPGVQDLQGVRALGFSTLPCSPYTYRGGERRVSGFRTLLCSAPTSEGNLAHPLFVIHPRVSTSPPTFPPACPPTSPPPRLL